MSEAQEPSQAAQAILDSLPRRDEAHALVLELQAYLERRAPLPHASAARLCIIVTSAAFVRRFGRAVLLDVDRLPAGSAAEAGGNARKDASTGGADLPPGGAREDR
jgi:hypothetical protein